MDTATAPSSAGEALDMVRAGLGYLAAADAAQLPSATQAECLRELERDAAVLTRASLESCSKSGENAGLCLTPTNASWANPRPSSGPSAPLS